MELRNTGESRLSDSLCGMVLPALQKSPKPPLWWQGNEFGGKAVIQAREGDTWKVLATEDIRSACFVAVVLF